MNKEQIVTDIYMLMHKLRDTKRTGWYDENINRERVESVADHIYGCQMLAQAMYSEFNYDIDINKVILMLLIHEIGETVIGDISYEGIPSSEKKILEDKAVEEIIKVFPNSSLIKNLYYEFEAKETNEARFAFQIDKAECGIQSALYDQEGCFKENYNIGEIKNNWINYDRKKGIYDENFDSLLEFAVNNELQIMNKTDNKIQNVINYYCITNKLKDTRRTGEILWNIKKEHYGSIAEHIYSVQILSVIIALVYEMEIDIALLVSLISVHELGEIKIGDISSLLKTKEQHNEEYSEAIKIAKQLTNNEFIINNYIEYENNETKEAIFAKYADKLAPDIISKIYDKDNLIDLANQNNNPVIKNELVASLLNEYNCFYKMWMKYGQDMYHYPEPFILISEYVFNNEIKEIKIMK